MTLAEKVNSVEEVFQALDHDLTSFQTQSGLHCKSGCGKCCQKPDIDATVLEFLPMAYHAFKQNTSEELYEKASSQPDGLCLMLDSTKSSGMCLDYKFRGMVCRVFGFTARINRLGLKDMITCRTIKTEQEENYSKVITGAPEGIPLAQSYYRRLMNIDADLGRTQYPINVAIKKAIEEVMHYFAYRESGEE
jgi:Fe-S-cluster containining protein